MAATFFVTTLALESIVACCRYLITQHNFTFVLTGKLQSDPIEGRFGWYRRLNGANFFMSVKQLLEAEKKIRVLNQLSQVYIPHEDVLPQATMTDDDQRLRGDACAWLVDELSVVADISLDELAEGERIVLFFVADCLGRSICKQRQCSDCKTLLISNHEIQPSLESHLELNDDMRRLFDMADRGGLAVPSEYTLSVCSVAFVYFTRINSDNERSQKFFKCKQQQLLFVDVVKKLSSEKQSIRSPHYG